MVASGIFLTLNDATAKWLVPHYPVGELLFLRTAFVLPLLLFAALRVGAGASLRVQSWPAQLTRGVIMLASTVAFMTGLRYLSLGDALAVAFASPLVITLLAPLVLGETVGLRRRLAVAVGFAGVLLMLRPGTGAFQWAILLPLLVAFTDGTRDVLTRRMMSRESTITTLIISTTVVSVSGLLSAPFGWIMPSWPHIGLLALSGLLYGGAHFLMIESLRHADASVVAPFKYVALVWGIVVGWLLWGDVPDGFAIAGTALIVGSGLYVLRRSPGRSGRPGPTGSSGAPGPSGPTGS